MLNPLENFLIQTIQAHGPLSVDAFMMHALSHPIHGYYMKNDPFGAKGDFTTAPEVSQMFGELIGAWTADTWQKMGAPDHFILLECGPGRGTLMRDILRATAKSPGFHKAIQIHLLEMSPVLKAKQEKALENYDVHWHEGLETIPNDKPVIIIANEFLDALPIKQLQKTEKGWQERVIGWSENEGFHWGYKAFSKEVERLLPNILGAGQVGDIYEFSPAIENFTQNLAPLLSKHGGAALFIDYGHVAHGFGDTLQGVYKHQSIDILEKVGDADMTAHVNFMRLSECFMGLKGAVYGPVLQGVFLKQLGIDIRAEMLKQNANQTQTEDIDQALHRLTHPDQMGLLFKAFGVTYGFSGPLAGF